MKFVFDTKVLVRVATRPLGPARRLFDVAIDLGHTLVSSAKAVEEFTDVVGRPKLIARSQETPEGVRAVVVRITAAMELIATSDIELPIACRDPKDQIYIETAVAGRVAVLCTLDRDLHDPAVVAFLASHGTRVLTDVELLNELLSPRSPPMGRIVIAVYRPKPGKAEELHALVREHLPILRKLGLATERAPIAMKAADGTVLEVFEWRSEEATQQAHKNPTVLEMWGRFGAACDMVRPADVAEISQMFAHYEPLD